MALRVLVVGLGVGGRVAVDLAPRARVVAHAPEVVAVRHGREGAVEGQDLEPVPRQVQLADDLGPQQRHHVRADRELEAGEDFLGHGRAAEHVAALEHEHLLAGAGQVGGGDEAVVAAADDDRVVGLGHEDARILVAVKGRKDVGSRAAGAGYLLRSARPAPRGRP